MECKVDAHKTYLISDTHFGHDNIIKYDNRPFKNTEEMDEHMILKWNQTVEPDDTVIHLGDVFWGRNNEERMLSVMSRLNGHKWLVKGNHDIDFIEIASSFFEVIEPYLELKLFKNLEVSHHNVILCHYPISVWNKMHKGSYHFHGHTHGSFKGVGKILDVGVNNKHMNYTPKSIKELIEIVDK